MNNDHEQIAVSETLRIAREMKAKSEEHGFLFKSNSLGFSISYKGFTGRQEYIWRTLAQMALIAAATGTPMSVAMNEKYGVLQPQVDMQDRDVYPTIGQMFSALNYSLNVFLSEQQDLDPSHVFWRLPQAPGLNATMAERDVAAYLENVFETGTFYNRSFMRDHFVYLYVTKGFEYAVIEEGQQAGTPETKQDRPRRLVDVSETCTLGYTKSVSRIVEQVMQCQL